MIVQFYLRILLNILCLLFTLPMVTKSIQFTVVNSDGIMKPSPILKQYFTKDGQVKYDSVATILDCSSSTGDPTCINELFKSNFQIMANGISVDIVDGLLLIRANYDEMYSNKFCGSKAVDLFLKLNLPIAILLNTDEAADMLHFLKPLFLRIVHFCKDSTAENVQISVLLNKHDADISSVVENYLQNIWDNLIGNGKSFQDKITLRVLSIKSEKGDDLKNKLFSSSMSDDLSGAFLNSWSVIPSSIAPVFTKEDHMQMYELEKAYFFYLQQSELALAQMQQRIADGKSVSNFAMRVQKLLLSVLSDFNGQVKGNTLIRERISRSRNLREFILSMSQHFLEQLWQIARMNAAKKFKSELKNIYRQGEFFSDQNDQKNAELIERYSNDELVQLAIRKSVDELSNAVTELQNEKIGLKISEESFDSFTSELEELAKGFPDSAEARFIEKQKIDKISQDGIEKKSRRKKKFGGFGVNLSLVGMLRPPGFGNFQGYLAHANQIFGLPVEFLLGVQNDGDSVEVLANDREVPWLRIQPKINFDIDF